MSDIQTVVVTCHSAVFVLGLVMFLLPGKRIFNSYRSDGSPRYEEHSIAGRGLVLMVVAVVFGVVLFLMTRG